MLRSRGSRGLLTALVLAAAPVVSGCSTAAAPPASEPVTPGPAASAQASGGGPRVSDRRRADRDRALRVLRGWDSRRAAAFADGDAEAVRSLYAPSTGLAHQDVALLHHYARRGARVTALVPQVVESRVLLSSPHVVELVVVERLGVAEVSVAGEQRTLPGSRFVRHALRFVRKQGSWRLSSVRGE